MKKVNLLKSICVLAILIFTNFKSQENRAELEYQNDKLIQNLGNGLVQLIKTNEKIVLYNDKSLSQVKTKNAKFGKDVIPLLNKPDYGILFFSCIEKSDKFYKIVTAKNEYAYLKASQHLIYYSWIDFLKEQVTSIENKDVTKNNLRDSIDGKVIDMKNWKHNDEIEIIDVQGNWLQIKNVTQNNRVFWIQWRTAKELKVYLNLLM